MVREHEKTAKEIRDGERNEKQDDIMIQQSIGVGPKQ